MPHLATRSTAAASLRRLSLAAASLTLHASLALCPGAASAAGIYVIDSRIDRDGVSALAPTFIATPGERALIAYENERDIEVAMTVIEREGASADGALEVYVELIENMEVSDARLDVMLGRPGTVTLGEREISVLVREQTPLPDAAAGSGAEASGADAAQGEDDSGGTDSNGTGTGDADSGGVQSDGAQGEAGQETSESATSGG